MNHFLYLTIVLFQLTLVTASLSRELLSDVHDQIIRKTSKNDVLVFLGETVSQFYPVVKDSRDAISLPLSVENLDKWHPQHSHKAEFFADIIEPIMQRQSKRIVLVDHSLHGDNVDLFKTELSGSCPECDVAFLNILTTSQKNGAYMKPTKVEALSSVVLKSPEGDALFDDHFSPILSDEILEAIISARDKILGMTTDNDILLFVGNAGSYIYHAIKNNRESFAVPISGRYNPSAGVYQAAKGNMQVYRDTMKWISDARLSYQTAFLAPITELAKKSRQRIVLISYSKGGSSIDSFHNMMKATCDECKSVLLGILPRSMYDQRRDFVTNPRTMKTIGYIPLPNVCNQFFVDGNFIRLSPPFPVNEWHNAFPDMMARYEARPEIKTAIDQIMLYSSTHLPVKTLKSRIISKIRFK